MISYEAERCWCKDYSMDKVFVVETHWLNRREETILSLGAGSWKKKIWTSKVSEGERKELMLETVLIRFVSIKSYCYNFRKWMVELENYIWWDFFSPHWCSFTSCNWKLTVQILDFLPLYYKTSAACCKIETKKHSSL